MAPWIGTYSMNYIWCPSQAATWLFIFAWPSSFFLSWLHSYLQDHTEQVIINGSLSSKSQVTSGVPQGSILRPLLFIIYINDIAKPSLLFSHPHSLCWWHSSLTRNFFSNFNVHCLIQHQSYFIVDCLSSSYHQLQKKSNTWLSLISLPLF